MPDNNIPIHWEAVKVSEIGELIRGVNYKKEESRTTSAENYLPILRSNNINGELNYDDLVYVKKRNISEAQLIRKDDIVFAMSSGSKHLVGKSAKAKTDFNGGFGAFCGVFRANELVNKNFVAYFFQSPYYKKFISEISKGTNINNLKREHILDLDFPFPPLPEQQSIVSKIEELLSDLENGKQQLQIAQQQLKVYRQSLLKWAFEGRLTNKNVKDGELPKDWKWVKVATIGQISTGSTPSKQNPKFYSDDFPFYKPTDLEAGYNVRVSYDNLSELGIKEARFLPVDSVLVTCIGATIGKTGIIRRAGASNQQINAIISSPDYNANFVYYQTIAPKFQQAIKDNAAATTLPILNKSKFQNLEMVSCPLGEQHHIVQELESKLTFCDKIEETISNSLQQVETLRQSILKKAFEGKLV